MKRFSVAQISQLMALKTGSIAVSIVISDTSTFIAFINSPWWQDSYV